MAASTKVFAPDRPGDLEQGDLFGHADYASVLTTAVLDTTDDYTFGLFGDWGLGKTTVLEEMTKRLRNKPHNGKCAVVKFDAWRYQADPFRREFLRELDAQLTEFKALRGWDTAKHLGQLDEDTSQARDVGFKLSRFQAVRTGAVIAILAAVLFGLLGGIVFSPAAGTVVALVAVMPVVVFLIARIEQVLQVQQVTISRKRLEDPDRFAAAFRTLVGHVNKDVLVIAIDNLDRLPAAEAVEVLATIKTFLEPEAAAARQSIAEQMRGRVAHTKTIVVFVVAVDDGALRRHLQTLGTPAGTGHHADEYLRKFFNSTLTLRQLLTGDLSAYIREQLAPVFERARGHGDAPPPDLDRQLELTVEMAAIALRRNPRRVRQFVGNLELQLRLLREREKPRGSAAPFIVPPVSGHVALVAKLELLAEEWPHAYASLRQDERRWAAWHLGDVREDEVDEGERAAFAALLHASREVDAGMLRAVLRMKRAKDELDILDFDEFRESVLGGDRTRLLRYELALRARDDDARMPVEMLPRIFKEELRSDRVETAMNVVDALLFFFIEDAEICRETLSDALANDEAAPRVGALDPDKLLEAGSLLSEPERVKLLRLLAESLQVEAPGERERRVIVRLAERIDELDEAGRAAVSAAVTAMASEFAHYAPLARADPRLLPGESAQAAIDWLRALTPGAVFGNTPSGHGRPLDVRSMFQTPPFEVLRAAVLGGATAGQEDEALEALTAALTRLDGEPAAALALVEFVTELTPVVRRAGFERLLDFVTSATATPVPAMSDRLRLLHACGRLIDAAGQEAKPDLVDRIGVTDGALASYVLEHEGDLPASLRRPVRARLMDSPDAHEVARESLDRVATARAVSPERLALTLNDWMRADSAHLDRVRTLAVLAAGPHPSGRERAQDLDVRALRVEDVLPEDRDAVDPAPYLARLVLDVSDGEAFSRVVVFHGRLRLTLGRAGDDVHAVVHDVEWAGAEP